MLTANSLVWRHHCLTTMTFAFFWHDANINVTIVLVLVLLITFFLKTETLNVNSHTIKATWHLRMLQRPVICWTSETLKFVYYNSLLLLLSVLKAFWKQADNKFVSRLFEARPIWKSLEHKKKNRIDISLILIEGL